MEVSSSTAPMDWLLAYGRLQGTPGAFPHGTAYFSVLLHSNEVTVRRAMRDCALMETP